MATKDRKEWQALLSKWGYTSALRKHPEYICKDSTAKILKYLRDTEASDADVQILLNQGRLGNFKYPIFIFPQAVRISPVDNDSLGGIFELDEPILYGTFQTVEQFIPGCPRLKSAKEPIYMYRFPFNLLFMSDGHFRRLQKSFLAPLKKFLVQYKVTTDFKGRIKKKAEAFREFIESEYLKAGCPQKFKVTQALDKWFDAQATSDKPYEPEAKQVYRIIADFNKRRGF